VGTLINQLAEVRSQLELGNTDYEYDWHHLPRHPAEDGQQRQQREARSQRLKRQIGGLLDNCGCPAGTDFMKIHFG
jgi:hypothetical protein